jgi:hypothetical protein
MELSHGKVSETEIVWVEGTTPQTGANSKMEAPRRGLGKGQY